MDRGRYFSQKKSVRVCWSVLECGGGHGKRRSRGIKPASRIKLSDWLDGFEVGLITGLCEGNE